MPEHIREYFPFKQEQNKEGEDWLFQAPLGQGFDISCTDRKQMYMEMEALKPKDARWGNDTKGEEFICNWTCCNKLSNGTKI